LNAIPIKIPLSFFKDTKKSVLIFIWMHKRSWILKAIINKETNVGSITITNFKLTSRFCLEARGWGEMEGIGVGGRNGPNNAFTY
jgi:hypothetical protein